MVEWNKEIKLSDLRRKKNGKPAADEESTAQLPEPEAQPVEEAPVEKPAKQPKAEKSSLLKRDISFKRKPKAKKEKAPKASGEEAPKKPKRERRSKGGPAPKRAKRLVGLKIGASQIAAARIVNNGVPELVQVAREELDQGLIVGGELRVDEEGNAVSRILLVVAYRELIDRYVAACKKAGLRLAGIDLEAFALLRALAQPRGDDDPPADAAVFVVSIGHDRSTFAVSDGRVCEFTRVLDWGGTTLDVAIAREIGLAPSEAEPVKRELSLASTTVPEGLTPEQAERAREAVHRQLQTFARELVSSLQFYQNQPGSLGIGEIVITGGTAHLVGLAHELQK